MATRHSQCFSRPLLGVLLWGAIAVPPLPLLAQSRSQQDQLEEPTLPESLPTLEELLPTLQPPEQPSDNELIDVPDTITVKAFRVLGSTVFTQAAFDQLLASYTNTPLSLTGLLQAQEAIATKYVEAGYITSGAYIPPQTLTNDVVEIQVIEGSVDEIKIQGLQRLQESYLRSRLALAAAAPLHQGRLLESLQVLQLDPLIQRLSVELAAGTRPGSSILDVRVVEADPFSAIARLDNQRSPSVGSIRRQLGLTHNNLLGFGDRLEVSYINTQGSDSLDNLSWAIPVNAKNGTLGLRHSRTSSSIIEDPFNLIDIESQSKLYEVNFRQPILQKPNQDLALGLTFAHQHSQTFILGDIGFPLSNGADEEGITRISALRFFQEFTNRNSQQVLALRSQFNMGMDVLDSTQNSGKVPDSDFFSWRGQGQYLRLLSPDTTILLRGDVQWSPQPLVPLEQFSIGGAASVRGYRQDVQLGDRGLFGSVELRTAIAKIPSWNSRIEVTPFIDWGAVWNHRDSEATISKDILWSMGFGLRWLMGDNFHARLDWGIPMVELETTGDTLQENGVYFSLEYNFF